MNDENSSIKNTLLYISILTVYSYFSTFMKTYEIMRFVNLVPLPILRKNKLFLNEVLSFLMNLQSLIQYRNTNNEGAFITILIRRKF